MAKKMTVLEQVREIAESRLKADWNPYGENYESTQKVGRHYIAYQRTAFKQTEIYLGKSLEEVKEWAKAWDNIKA